MTRLPGKRRRRRPRQTYRCRPPARRTCDVASKQILWNITCEVGRGVRAGGACLPCRLPWLFVYRPRFSLCKRRRLRQGDAQPLKPASISPQPRPLAHSRLTSTLLRPAARSRCSPRWRSDLRIAAQRS